MIFTYKAKGGAVLEVERPIGRAPKAVTRRGVKYERVYEMPTLRQLTALDRGDKPSVSHQFPTWYGFRQRDACWGEFMRKANLEDTPANRRSFMDRGMGPSPRQIERASKAAAERAGALDRFDKRGNLIAKTKAGVAKNLDLVKKVDPTVSVVWD